MKVLNLENLLKSVTTEFRTAVASFNIGTSNQNGNNLSHVQSRPRINRNRSVYTPYSDESETEENNEHFASISTTRTQCRKVNSPKFTTFYRERGMERMVQ